MVADLLNLIVASIVVIFAYCTWSCISHASFIVMLLFVLSINASVPKSPFCPPGEVPPATLYLLITFPEIVL